MKITMRALAVVVVVLATAISVSADAPQCGWQNEFKLCPDGLCCSKWGLCGSTPDYCDIHQGCQSQCQEPQPQSLAVSAGEQCGRQAAGKLCPNGLCCSKWGFCGSTPDYCSLQEGCQSQCKGGAVSVRAGEQCGSQAGGKLCPNCLCCSKWGFCGSTPEYCGEGCQSQCNGCDTRNGTLISTKTAASLYAGEQCGSQAGGKLCPNGLCCSKWGFCGSTPDYCCDGCQSQCKPNDCLYHADA